MSEERVYTREELARLRAELARTGIPTCPRCDKTLQGRPVPRPDAVSYVRKRTWYVCSECGRSAVLDRRSP